MGKHTPWGPLGKHPRQVRTRNPTKSRETNSSHLFHPVLPLTPSVWGTAFYMEFTCSLNIMLVATCGASPSAGVIFSVWLEFKHVLVHPGGGISTTCAVSVQRDHLECKYVFIYFSKLLNLRRTMVSDIKHMKWNVMGSTNMGKFCCDRIVRDAVIQLFLRFNLRNSSTLSCTLLEVIDCFIVSLHNPNGRHLRLCKQTVNGL